MSVVRPSELLAAELILDAVTYHADPDQWSGDSLMVCVCVCAVRSVGLLISEWVKWSVDASRIELLVCRFIIR